MLFHLWWHGGGMEIRNHVGIYPIALHVLDLAPQSCHPLGDGVLWKEKLGAGGARRLLDVEEELADGVLGVVGQVTDASEPGLEARGRRGGGLGGGVHQEWLHHLELLLDEGQVLLHHVGHLLLGPRTVQLRQRD